MDWDQCKISEFNLVQFTLLIFYMHKYHKYKSKCYNELSLTLIIPKGIPLLWPIPLPTIHPCLPTPPSFYFFSNCVILKSGFTLRVTPAQWCHSQMTNREGNMSDQKQKVMGSQCLLKVSNDSLARKGRKRRREGREKNGWQQFPGCGNWAQTSHHHIIVSKDAKHYWPTSTWLKSI